MGIVLGSTFLHKVPPIKVISTSVEVIKSSQDINLTVNRSLDISKTQEKTVITTTLTNKETGKTLTLPDSPIKFTNNINQIKRTFILPKDLPAGMWCVESDVSWKPMFSLIEHNEHADQDCFLIK